MDLRGFWWWILLKEGKFRGCRFGKNVNGRQVEILRNF